MSIIDRLVVQLDLDGKGFLDGAAQSLAALRALEKQAGLTGQGMAREGARMAASLSGVQRQAAGVLTVLTGGKSLKAVIGAADKAHAGLSAMAQRLNMDPTGLTRLEAAAKAAGGAFGEVGQSFSKLQQRLKDPQEHQKIAEAFGRLGLPDFQDKNGQIHRDLVTRVNQGVHQNPALSQQGARNAMQALDFGPGMTAQALMPPKDFDTLQQHVSLMTAPFEAMHAALRHLGQGLDHVGQHSDGLAKSFVTLRQETPKAVEAFPLMKQVVQEAGASLGGLGQLLVHRASANPRTNQADDARRAALDTARETKTAPEPPARPRIDPKGGNAGAFARRLRPSENQDKSDLPKKLADQFLPSFLAGKMTASSGNDLAAAWLNAAQALPRVGAMPSPERDAPAMSTTKGSQSIKSRGQPRHGRNRPLNAHPPHGRRRDRPSISSSPLFGLFADIVSQKESHGRYAITGGAHNSYYGKYQLGRAAIADAARRRHEKTPSLDRYLHNPAMQERYFRAFTDQNDKTLTSISPQYRALGHAEKLAVLGYAHNQGAGGASKWLLTRQGQKDGFGTAAQDYAVAIMRGEAHLSALASGAAPGQSLPDKMASDLIGSLFQTVRTQTGLDERARATQIDHVKSLYETNRKQIIANSWHFRKNSLPSIVSQLEAGYSPGRIASLSQTTHQNMALYGDVVVHSPASNAQELARDLGPQLRRVLSTGNTRGIQ